MRVAERIDAKLREALSPTHLEIVDESHKHEGHAGWRPGGQTHFRVHVVSQQFQGQGRVARQRMVYSALADELADRVHALQLTTLTPEEDAAP